MPMIRSADDSNSADYSLIVNDYHVSNCSLMIAFSSEAICSQCAHNSIHTRIVHTIHHVDMLD